MCKVIDFSLGPACFPSVRPWSWQDSPTCRGFASTWAPARQDRNPKCCFMLIWSSQPWCFPLQFILSVQGGPGELVAIFPSCVGLPRAGKEGMEASLSCGCDGCVLKAWQRLLHEAAQTHKHQRQEHYLGCYTGCHQGVFIQFWWARSQGEGVEVR